MAIFFIHIFQQFAAEGIDEALFPHAEFLDQGNGLVAGFVGKILIARGGIVLELKIHQQARRSGAEGQGLPQSGRGLGGEFRIAVGRIKGLEFGQGHVRHQPGPVGGARHIRVVHDDQFPIPGHAHVGLDHIHPQADGLLKGGQGVFRGGMALAPMGRHQHAALMSFPHHGVFPPKRFIPPL